VVLVVLVVLAASVVSSAVVAVASSVVVVSGAAVVPVSLASSVVAASVVAAVSVPSLVVGAPDDCAVPGAEVLSLVLVLAAAVDPDDVVASVPAVAPPPLSPQATRTSARGSHRGERVCMASP